MGCSSPRSHVLARLGVVLALACAVRAGAQSPAPPAARDRSAILGVARELMAAARYCTLVTLGEGGRPQARLMDPFAPEEELTVWMATNPRTRKVGQIRKDPRVTLVYFDPKSAGSVTLLGEAQLVDDTSERAKRWKAEWSNFYRDGNRGADYLLLRFKPRRLELVSAAHGLPSDPMAWAPVVVDFR